MRTRTWWGKKRPLEYEVFDAVGSDEDGYQIICPHGEGAVSLKPGKHYCLSVDGRALLEDLGLGLSMHMTYPIEHLHYDKRIKVGVGAK